MNKEKIAMKKFLSVKLKRQRFHGAIAAVPVILAALFYLSISSAMASDLIIPIEMPQYNFAGVGIGAYSDYIGSDDYKWGAAPIAHVSFGGERYVSLLANDLRVNIIDDRNWRLGPEFLYRFERDDVDDDVVSKLHKIDGSANLGLFGGYIWKDPAELRKQFGITLWGLWDVSSVSKGWNAGVNVFGMYPVARPVTLAAGAGATYGDGNYTDTYFGVSGADSLASGLPAFSAGGGMRDARCWVMAMLHLSEKWHTGAGLLYSRMLGDAADSPIVADRGSKDQWIYGIGLLYSWQ